MLLSIAKNVSRLNAILYPEGEVKTVKAAGVWVFAKEPSTQTYNVLMGEMVKNDPKKPETHMFDKTYSGFSGKSKVNEGPIDTAVRELQEETFGIFGTDQDMLSIVASDKTQVLKNMGWSKYPVATFLIEVEYSDKYIEKFNTLRSDTSELSKLKWVPLDRIWWSLDNNMVEGSGMNWREYNSAKNLTSLFTPLNGVYSGTELELKKNALKHNLQVFAKDENIHIADYVARTFMEYESDIKTLFPSVSM